MPDCQSSVMLRTETLWWGQMTEVGNPTDALRRQMNMLRVLASWGAPQWLWWSFCSWYPRCYWDCWLCVSRDRLPKCASHMPGTDSFRYRSLSWPLRYGLYRSCLMMTRMLLRVKSMLMQRPIGTSWTRCGSWKGMRRSVRPRQWCISRGQRCRKEGFCLRNGVSLQFRHTFWWEFFLGFLHIQDHTL